MTKKLNFIKAETIKIDMIHQCCKLMITVRDIYKNQYRFQQQQQKHSDNFPAILLLKNKTAQ